MVDPETMSIVELYHVVITMAEHFPKDVILRSPRIPGKTSPRNGESKKYERLTRKKERGNSERRLALELDIFEGKERDRSTAFERSYLAITRIAEAH